MALASTADYPGTALADFIVLQAIDEGVDAKRQKRAQRKHKAPAADKGVSLGRTSSTMSTVPSSSQIVSNIILAKTGGSWSSNMPQ